MWEEKKNCEFPSVGKRTKKKLAPGICDFCGKEQPLCYICTNCELTICQNCFIENQKRFTRSGVTWVCPNCLNWETL